MNKKSVKLKAPAKINLTLNIGAKRADGYHDVDMIMQSVNLYDEVEITLTKSRKITTECNLYYLPTDERNIAYKAAFEFFKRSNIINSGVKIILNKNIPVCAGLAGGSSNCAAVLIGLNKLYGNILSDSMIISIAESLGKDVPFCIKGATALATGTGTTLTRIHDMPSCNILLVKPDLSVSTKEAYDKADLREQDNIKNSDDMINALNSGDIKHISSLLYNDFENILKIEEIEKIKEMLLQNGACGACMSGSGPTVYGLFDDHEKTQNAYDVFSTLYPNVHICRPITHGCTFIN